MTPRAAQDRAGSPERGSHGAPNSHITPGHVRAFQAVTSQLYDNIVLWSCWIDGEPGVAIVMLDHVGEGKVAVMPLFVAITETMDVCFDSDQSGGRARSGGPRRSTVQREFEASLASLVPGGGR